jgi:hypothetical protein
MDEILHIIIGASVLVIVFDTLGSVASRQMGFPYVRLIVGSSLIYGTVGYLAAPLVTMAQGGLAASVVGLVDATIGWAISWAIGPGRLPVGQANASKIMNTIVIVVGLAGVLGIVGGFLSRVT